MLFKAVTLSLIATTSGYNNISITESLDADSQMVIKGQL